MNKQPTSTAPKRDFSWAAPNKRVWIEVAPDANGECFRKGTIFKIATADLFNVRYDEDYKPPHDIKNEKVYPINENSKQSGIDDLVELEVLVEPELINNLKIRYKQDLMYTFVGPTLVSINPWKEIDGLYSDKSFRYYEKALGTKGFNRKQHPPHIFAIGASALDDLYTNRKNQAIVISGESGAGKTENARWAMKFVSGGNDEDISRKIVACNPILEAFGNAETTLNPNSSRFGKYIELIVDLNTKKVSGATMKNYLLEKTRVCFQNPGEKNFHIFYHFVRGASLEKLKEYFLIDKPEEYGYLKNTEFKQVDPKYDAKMFKEVEESFKLIGFSDLEMNSIWSIISATLLLGNIEFDDSTLNDSDPCKIVNETAFANACKLLAVNDTNLASSLRHKFRKVGGQSMQTPTGKEDCIVFRDSLAKELYNRLFTWIVRRLNYTTVPSTWIKDDTIVQIDAPSVGLLDIFGFEISASKNSLEQFCINYTNERIQKLYIDLVINGEEGEFKKEGLSEFWNRSNFKDNQPVIDLIDKGNSGIFQKIEEYTTTNSTDQALLNYISKDPRKSKDAFLVQHSAKDVEYTITKFISKNKDEISPAISDTVVASTLPDVVKIWKGLCGNEKEIDKSNVKPGPKDKQLCYKFRLDISSLMTKLESCSCHFVRCMRPNETKKPGELNPSIVLQQIKYMGILDTIKVRKESFPVRRAYRDFIERYQDIDKELGDQAFEDMLAKGVDFKKLTKDALTKALPKLGNDLMLYGETRLFLKDQGVIIIDNKKNEMIAGKIKAVKIFKHGYYRSKLKKSIKAILKITRAIKNFGGSFKDRRNFLKIRRAVLKIQRLNRKICRRNLLIKQIKCATVIQKNYKRHYWQKKWIMTQIASEMINKLIRGYLVRSRLKKLRYVQKIVRDIVEIAAEKLVYKIRKAAAVMIKKWLSGHVCRCNNYDKVLQIRKFKADFIFNKCAIIIQRNVRGLIVRKTLLRLNRAAFYIQGFVKMRWLSGLFQELRSVTVRIQKAVRAWLIRKHIIDSKTTTYFAYEQTIFENLRAAEQVTFFGIQKVKSTRNPLKNLQQNTIETERRQSDRKSESSFAYSNTSGQNLGGIHPTSRTNKSTTSFENFLQNQMLYSDPQEFNSFSQSLNTAREVSPYSIKKINLFSRVLDVDLTADLSEVYEPLWSFQALQLQFECMNSDAELQMFEIGEAHTLAASNTSKIFSFGWNDSYQLGRPHDKRGPGSQYSPINFGIEPFRAKSIAAGDNHNLLLDVYGNLYVWGDNSKGQLGLGHCRDIPKISILDFVQNDIITEVKAKGNTSVVVTQSGRVFTWPLTKETGELITRPVELNLPPKIQIASAACGYNFSVLTSKYGLVFTFGKDNSFGQLGHGDLLPRDTPTLVEGLKKDGEKVTAVACGFKHVICKTSLGKVYTWGWGEVGQLGHGNFENQLAPRLVNSFYPNVKSKVVSINAGFKHSMALTENKKVFWWGTNATIENTCVPTELQLSNKIPDMSPEFYPVRLLSAWSKTLNLSYVTIADCRTVEIQSNLKSKVLATLISKFEEQFATSDIDPPYVDTISKYFTTRVMKTVPSLKEKKIFKENLKGASKQSSNATLPTMATAGLEYTNNNTSSFAKLKGNLTLQSQENLPSRDEIYEAPSKNYDTFSPFKPNQDLRSPSFNPTHEDQIPSSDYETDQSDSKEELEQLNVKLKEIKKRMEDILRIPRDRWSETDLEFMKIATEPKMYTLLNNIQ